MMERKSSREEEEGGGGKKKDRSYPILSPTFTLPYPTLTYPLTILSSDYPILSYPLSLSPIPYPLTDDSADLPLPSFVLSRRISYLLSYPIPYPFPYPLPYAILLSYPPILSSYPIYPIPLSPLTSKIILFFLLLVGEDRIG